MTTLTISPECANNYPEACTDERCEAAEHLPERDVVWSEVDEDAAWLWDDDVQRRRADR